MLGPILQKLDSGFGHHFSESKFGRGEPICVEYYIQRRKHNAHLRGGLLGGNRHQSFDEVRIEPAGCKIRLGEDALVEGQ
jgi:hypothetical protein